MSLIPGFDFDQCFDILELFIENNAKNGQIKKAMEIVYDEKYITDENLGSIKDITGEVIKKDENGIHILYKKKDLQAVRNYFQNLNINDESFGSLQVNINIIGSFSSSESFLSSSFCLFLDNRTNSGKGLLSLLLTFFSVLSSSSLSLNLIPSKRSSLVQPDFLHLLHFNKKSNSK